MTERTSRRPEQGARTNARALLLDAAERLFAMHGIDGISLREIALAAGQRNNSAISYHFGDKLQLVDALLADRVGRIEVLRAGMLEMCGARLDAQALLRCLWQPILDIDTGRQGHWFARFQLACHFQNPQAGHPLGNDPERYPASTRILRNMNSIYGHLTSDHFVYRMSLTAMMFLSAVCRHDKALSENLTRWSSHFSLDETIKLATGALGAPA